MPYIDPERRVKLVGGCPIDSYPRTPGELAFVIADAIDSYLSVQEEVRFDHLSAAEGAVESALREFQRRVVNPYEDRKREENGDVFDAARDVAGVT